MGAWPRKDVYKRQAYRRARLAGVETQVLAAVSARLWPKLKAVAAAYPGLYPSYGLLAMDVYAFGEGAARL